MSDEEREMLLSKFKDMENNLIALEMALKQSISISLENITKIRFEIAEILKRNEQN
jgi:hypothetical protein